MEAGENQPDLIEAEGVVAEAVEQDAQDGRVAESAETLSTDDQAQEAEPVGDETDVDGEAEAEEGKFREKLTEKQQLAWDKRIAKLTAKRTAIETERDALKAERDELRARSEKLSDAVVLKAAQDTGVLPELMDKPDAARIAEYGSAKASVAWFGDWLEDNVDPEATLDVGGRSYSRTEVRDIKRAWQAKLEGLEDVPGKLAQLKQQTREVLELGLAARKAGWKPGQNASAPVAATAAGTGGKPPLPKPPARVGPGGPAAAPRKPAGAARPMPPNVDGITDEDGLARLIEQGLA
jgi:hypothetical protein